MGCAHSSFCCCEPSAASTTTATAVSDHGEGRAGLRHVLSGSALASVAVPSAAFCLQSASLTQKGYYPDDPDRANQDAFCVLSNLQGNSDIHLFGVFDGHGQFGGECAQFVRDKLTEILAAEQSLSSNLLSVYSSAFLNVNEKLHASPIDDTMSGTTAITVLVKGDMLYVANVGDSRAVAGVWNGETVVAEELSSDQTPFRKDEYERVRQCGARVLSVDQVEGVKDPDIQSWGNEDSDDGDPPRLWVPNAMYPGTAFTRSLGDSTAESIGVIAEPEIKTVKITPNHLFFVVASDGVFEFLSSQAVVDMVSRFVDPRDACSAVAAESYKLWLEHENRTDDITIIIVHIKDLCDSDVAADEASPANNKDNPTSVKLKADKCVYPESESCLLNKDSRTTLDYSSDTIVERNSECVAPHINSTDKNVID